MENVFCFEYSDKSTSWMVTNSGQSQSDSLQILNTKTETMQIDNFKNK